MLDTNLVLLSRLGKVARPRKATAATAEQTVAWIKGLARLGFAPSENLLEAATQNVKAQGDILESVRQHLGAHVDYNALHGDFVEYMKNSSDLQIYVDAIMHYLSVAFSADDLNPQTASSVREALAVDHLKVLDGASVTEARELAESIASQGQPYSDTDFENLLELGSLLRPNSVDVTVRENLARLSSVDSEWTSQMKTVTDVLRLAAVLSGGDVSLAERTRFRLSRSQRRLLATTLDRVLRDNGNDHSDFARHREEWKRLIRSAHFGDFSLPAVTAAVSAVYNESARSFESRLDAAKLQSVEATLELLKTRPGVFARQLMDLIRSNPLNRRQILGTFGEVADQVSLRVLIQLYDYARGPVTTDLPAQPIFTKTRTSQGVLQNKRRGDYSDVQTVIETKGFAGRLSDQAYDVDLTAASQYAIPMGVRTASPSMRAIGRGSRVKLDEGMSVARLFMHWKNGPGRVDLDLSANFFSEGFKKSGAVTYYSLRESSGSIYHSGDIVDAPNGAAEFVDIHIAKAIAAGWRYVALTVNSYSGQALASVPEAWAGVMSRKDVNSGENFEAATVTTRFDLVSEQRMTVPLILDLQTREMIWVDRPIAVYEAASNVGNTVNRAAATLQEAVLQPRMTVAELLEFTDAEVSDKGDTLDPSRTEQVLNLIA